ADEAVRKATDPLAVAQANAADLIVVKVNRLVGYDVHCLSLRPPGSMPWSLPRWTRLSVSPREWHLPLPSRSWTMPVGWPPPHCLPPNRQHRPAPSRV